MPTYIQLLTLTPEGREKALGNPERVRWTQDHIEDDEVRVLGLYGVLGIYDFVSMVDAPDNESIARYSMELGVRAGVSIITLPAIPIARLEGRLGPSSLEQEIADTLRPA